MFATLAADYPREPRAGEPDVLARRRSPPGRRRDHGRRAREVVAREFINGRPQGAGAVRPRRCSPTATSPTRTGCARWSRASGARAPTGSWPCPTAPTCTRPASTGRPPGARRSRSTPGSGPIGRPTSWSSRSSSGRTRIARLADPGGAPREVLALGLAEALNAELRALAAAGCPIIQVDEGALTTIGDDEAEWASLRRDAATADRRARRSTT